MENRRRSKRRSKRRSLLGCALAATMALTTVGSVNVATAKAAEDTDEIMLGVFWTSDADTTDTLYFSTDGVTFREICEAYTDATPTDEGSSKITKTRHTYEYATGEQLKALGLSGVSGLDVDPVMLQVDANGNYIQHGTATTNDETLHDPSIIYRDGYFWMLSGGTDGTGDSRRVVAMLGYSKDLINWSFPASGSKTNIKLSELPSVNNDRAQYYDESKWDMVAPDFFVDDNGDVYIVFSIGYFALFHNEDTRKDRTTCDEMYPYIVKIENITMPTVRDTSNTEAYVPDPAKLPEPEISVTYGEATPIKLPCMTARENVAHNHIDASVYKEGEYYYYTVKENGVTNEIWRTKDISKAGDPSAWEIVSYDAVTGYEGPCLTKYNGQYFLYMDRLSSFQPTDLKGDQAAYPFGSEGTWVAKATIDTTGELDGYTGWLESNIKQIRTLRKDGSEKANRHGTVITVSGEAAKVVRAAAKTAGYADKDLYGSYNKDDWASTGWYQKETYLDQDIYGTDVAFRKYFYKDGKRLGTKFHNNRGEEAYLNLYSLDGSGDGNWVYFEVDAKDPEKDGKLAVASADDGYHKGDYQVAIPTDWNYYNELYEQGKSYPTNKGDYTQFFKWVRYDWQGIMQKSEDPGKRLIQDGKNEEWYRYDPDDGHMVKGAYTFVNDNGDDCVMWFDPESGVNPRDTSVEINGITYYMNEGGFIYYDSDRRDAVKRDVLPVVEFPLNVKQYFIEDEDTPSEGWYKPDGETGKWYWYEGGVRQGTVNDAKGVKGDGTVRGREIADPDTEQWYWLDAVYDGAVAVGKEVWIPYIYQDEAGISDEEKQSRANDSDEGMKELVLEYMKNGTGKWVRYDEKGQMMKGWKTIEGELEKYYPDQIGNTYYYDNKTGLMAKGKLTIDGVEHEFDETTGAMIK